MKLPKKGTNELSKYGFDWITLKVNLQGYKAPKGSNLAVLLLFAHFLKNGLITFFIFCIQLLGDDIDQLSRDGFDWIIAKVIFKVGKVRFGPFSRIYPYLTETIYDFVFMFHRKFGHNIHRIWDISQNRTFLTLNMTFRVIPYLSYFRMGLVQHQRRYMMQ